MFPDLAFRHEGYLSALEFVTQDLHQPVQVRFQVHRPIDGEGETSPLNTLAQRWSWKSSDQRTPEQLNNGSSSAVTMQIWWVISEDWNLGWQLYQGQYKATNSADCSAENVCSPIAFVAEVLKQRSTSLIQRPQGVPSYACGYPCLVKRPLLDLRVRMVPGMSVRQP